MVVRSAWHCARCGTLNLGTAEACRRCGAAPEAAAVAAAARDDAGLAAVLSLLLPGLGQLYTGRIAVALFAIGIPVAIGTVIAGVLLAIDPLLALALRVAVGLAAAAVALLAIYHGAVVWDAFTSRSTAGRGLRGKRRSDYLALGAVAVLLVILYVTLFRQATAWAALASRVFEPFQQSGGTAAEVWSGRDRLNVLLLGIDTRKGAGGVTQNTDTLIVLTIDPVHRKAGMLSIPRDTLVRIPGHGEEKVNAAFALGGADLARRTISEFLDVPIHSYALVDFDGFRRIIDAVGGVVIDAPLPIHDESYPTEDFGVTRLDIRAGPQLMDGETALRYSRSRHDSNDFSRADRQQRVIGALQDRAAAQNTVLQLPSLVDDLSDAVRTDLDPGNGLPLLRLGLGIDAKDIDRRVLKPALDGEPGQLRELNSPSGYYLVPIPGAVELLVTELFYDPHALR